MRLIEAERVIVPFGAHFPFSYKIKEPTGIEVERIMDILMLPEEGGDPKSIKFLFGDIIPTQAQILQYFQFENTIKSLSIGAERVNQKMKNAAIQHLTPDLAKKKEIHLMDFMKVKDYYFSEIKKIESLKEISLIGDAVIFKQFRQDMNNYILYRNIYTHGKLVFRNLAKDYLMQYAEKSSMAPSSIRVAMTELSSFNEFTRLTDKFLEEVNTHLSKLNRNQ